MQNMNPTAALFLSVSLSVFAASALASPWPSATQEGPDPAETVATQDTVVASGDTPDTPPALVEQEAPAEPDAGSEAPPADQNALGEPDEATPSPAESEVQAPPVAAEDAPTAETSVAPSQPQESTVPAQPADDSTADVPQPRTYIWLSPAEIRALPIESDANCDARCAAAWRQLNRASSEIPVLPNLANLEEDTGNLVLAKALVAVRLGDSAVTAALKDEVVNLLGLAIGTEGGASALAVGRRLVAYVIAADIIDLPVTRPHFDEIVFRPWLHSLVQREFEGRTLGSCHEDRPNNWGTHCGASRIAVAAYLGDEMEVARAAAVFRGWLGDRESYASFKFESEAFSWISDACFASAPECQPRPINPPGATLGGHNVDGVIVDDQRRAGGFSWPPPYTYYSYGALGGAVVQAAILQRFGFDAWQWGNQGLRRAVEWMFYDGDGKPKWDTCEDSNKRYVLDLVDHGYGSNFISRMSCAPGPSREGRNIGWTSWTHQRSIVPQLP
jgi:hypothetical protein